MLGPVGLKRFWVLGFGFRVLGLGFRGFGVCSLRQKAFGLKVQGLVAAPGSTSLLSCLRFD